MIMDISLSLGSAPVPLPLPGPRCKTTTTSPDWKRTAPSAAPITRQAHRSSLWEAPPTCCPPGCRSLPRTFTHLVLTPPIFSVRTIADLFPCLHFPTKMITCTCSPSAPQTLLLPWSVPMTISNSSKRTAMSPRRKMTWGKCLPTREQNTETNLCPVTTAICQSKQTSTSPLLLPLYTTLPHPCTLLHMSVGTPCRMASTPPPCFRTGEVGATTELKGDPVLVALIPRTAGTWRWDPVPVPRSEWPPWLWASWWSKDWTTSLPLTGSPDATLTSKHLLVRGQVLPLNSNHITELSC